MQRSAERNQCRQLGARLDENANWSSHRRGWELVWAALRLGRVQLAGLLTVTVVVYLLGLALPMIAQHAVDSIAEGVARSVLPWLTLAAILAIYLEAYFISLRQRLVITLGGLLSRRLSLKAFLRLMRMRVDAKKFSTGEVLNRFQQADKIPEFVLEILPQLVFDVGGGFISLLLIFFYDQVIGSVVLAITAISSFYMKSSVEKLDVLTENHFTVCGERQSILMESVVGISTIKSLALEVHRFVRWKSSTLKTVSTLQEMLHELRRIFVGTVFVNGAVTVIVLFLGCFRVVEHHLTLGELMALQLLAGRVFAPILSSVEIIRHYQQVKITLVELGKLMAESREEAVIRPPLRELKGGGVAVRGLTLRYSSSIRPALEDVTFTLPSSGLFALVGRNGSGKSSLISILLGLQRDFEGEVLIAGKEIRLYDPRWLRSQMGVVNQDTTLFSGSIRENVAAGTRETDEKHIRSALDFANASAFVEAMPKGIDTELEENARNLSGGQRQRIGIARAVVRDPPLLLFDEPTASLDAEAAVAFERRIAAWARDRLAILVTHHLASVRNADGILVLERGRLVGFESHATLIRDCASYAALWNDYLRSMDGEPHRD